ncbi:carboxyl-terminal processing protease CtpA [Oscillatoria sp. FACHB-1406]|uniref:carboxyl-terminal processing protease CtpA n=1 Tax=Oscillatoria sp. FACHB-1406 TaxID=2692846 RepID=UPI0016884A20|nr:PDZ domain-containing protein [Oscillatoria sp. FACHB-1406]
MGLRGLGKLIGAIALIFLCWLGGMSEAAAFSEAQNIVLESWRIVNRAYIDETFNHQNWWQLREKLLKRPLDNREQAYGTIREMLATLDDPFTRLLEPEQYRSLQVSTSGELSGVGLQIDLDAETGQLEAVSPIAGSPAEAAGIKPLDKIVEIDGLSTKDMALDEAARRMRGKAGTKVSLTIARPGETGRRKFEIVRDRIALNPVYAMLDTTSSSTPIGYVRLAQFSANATQEVAHAIAKLGKQGAQGYILDLRNNPGGLLQAGIEIARLWIDEGTLVYTVNRQGTLGSFEATGNAIADKPLVVLVNQGTASASEILAGALQDNGRAILVGEKTFGKGLIQSLFDLPDDAGLAVTVAKYETPSHQDIHKRGILPDRVVPQEPITLSEAGTSSDKQYLAAVEELGIIDN